MKLGYLNHSLVYTARRDTGFGKFSLKWGVATLARRDQANFSHDTMAESEKQPLLGKENKDGRAENTIQKRSSKCRIVGVVAIIGCIIIITAAVSGTVAFGVKFALYKNNAPDCRKSTINAAHSRSGSYSILDTVTSQDLMCYAKPLLHLSLTEGEDSAVEVYQTPCQEVETQPFLTHYDFNDLPSAEGPRPLFDENFSPQNYFMNGTIEVGIINATSTFTSQDIIDLCLFSDYYQYNRFLKAGIKWKNRTENAVCKTVTSDETDLTVSFNISEPMFAFLGLATTYPMQIDLINITAIGYGISNPGKNSTMVCQLNGEAATCDIALPNKQELRNGSTCIVAYEEGNPDGTYDYTNLTIDIPNKVEHDNPYKLRFKIYGFTSLGVVVLILAPFTIIILQIVGAFNLIWKKILQRRNKSTRSDSTCTEHHSVQDTNQVTCAPVEATTHHDPRPAADRQLVSIAGSDQLQQIIQQSAQIQKHQTPRGEITVDQDAAASRHESRDSHSSDPA
jgi:hypothetical protein